MGLDPFGGFSDKNLTIFDVFFIITRRSSKVGLTTWPIVWKASSSSLSEKRHHHQRSSISFLCWLGLQSASSASSSLKLCWSLERQSSCTAIASAAAKICNGRWPLACCFVFATSYAGGPGPGLGQAQQTIGLTDRPTWIVWCCQHYSLPRAHMCVCPSWNNARIASESVGYIVTKQTGSFGDPLRIGKRFQSFRKFFSKLFEKFGKNIRKKIEMGQSLKIAGILLYDIRMISQ